MLSLDASGSCMLVRFFYRINIASHSLLMNPVNNLSAHCKSCNKADLFGFYWSCNKADLFVVLLIGLTCFLSEKKFGLEC